MKKTILVVEDERPLADVIKIKLEKNGFTVVTSRSVDQALNFLKEGVVVDAIWLDHYLLGKADGLDLMAEIKGEGSPWASTPVFVVSNTSTPEKACSYLNLGAEKFYIKSNHKLEEIVEDIISFLSK